MILTRVPVLQPPDVLLFPGSAAGLVPAAPVDPDRRSLLSPLAAATGPTGLEGPTQSGRDLGETQQVLEVAEEGPPPPPGGAPSRTHVEPRVCLNKLLVNRRSPETNRFFSDAEDVSKHARTLEHSGYHATLALASCDRKYTMTRTIRRRFLTAEESLHSRVAVITVMT